MKRRVVRLYAAPVVATMVAIMPATMPGTAAAGTGTAPSHGGETTGGETTPYRLSGPDPFASCTADNFPGDAFTPNSEVEPWVAVNPADRRNLVVVWQQDRWNTGSARGVGLAVTHDGGRTWRRSALPGLTLCGGGPDARATNPWLAFDRDGTLYAAAITAGGNPLTTAVVVTRSADGGDTWSAPSTLVRSPMAEFFNDKPAVTVDPARPDRAYVVWNRRNLTEDAQELMFSRTTDGGRTWEPARALYRPADKGVGTIGNQIVVLPTGELVDVFMESGFPIGGGPSTPGTGESRIRLIRSADHGTSWSAPRTVTVAHPSTPVLPGTDKLIIAGSIVPGIAADPRTGAIYVTWSDRDVSPSGSGIALVASRDGGRSWTRPLRVGATPDSPAGGPGQAFRPQVDVADDGTVAVTYYDLRRDTAGPGTATDYWMTVCRGTGCALRGAPWRERHLGGPFDLEKAIRWFDGPFLGTYMGLTHVGRRFVAAFVMTGDEDPQDVYLVR
jgi:hypothetical protein